MLKITLFILVVTNISQPVLSEIHLNGYFIASQECAALHSIRKNTNPGNIKITKDMAYELISQNKADATHYRIRVKQAQPKERWVSVGCGIALVDCRKLAYGSNSQVSTPTVQPEYLLALSWQPAFCQNHRDKKECQTQTETRYDASHFTLHGLWPQPRNNVYCNVSKTHRKLDESSHWAQLPDPELKKKVYRALIKVMPGVASYLHRHEWIKHGTCYSETPDEYFQESMMLVEHINKSAVRDFFAANIGRKVSVDEIHTKFDAAFGEGASEKVHIKCEDGLITEFRINLKGEISSDTRVQELLRNAPKADSSCREGIIDPVGY